MVLSVIVGPSELQPACRGLPISHPDRVSVCELKKRRMISVAQIAFAGLPYPGVVVIAPNIKLNIYTGGIP